MARAWKVSCRGDPRHLLAFRGHLYPRHPCRGGGLNSYGRGVIAIAPPGLQGPRSGVGRRGEEAAPASVIALAAPVLAILRRHRFAERNDLDRHCGAGTRGLADDRVASRRDHDAFRGDDETVSLAAAPLARAVAVASAHNPAVVGESIDGNDEDADDNEKPSKESEHGQAPFVS